MIDENNIKQGSPFTGGANETGVGPTCAAISTQTWTPVQNLTNISQILYDKCMLKISQTHTTYRHRRRKWARLPFGPPGP